MAEDKKSFVAYIDWKSQIDLLSDEEAGKLIKHLFAYVNDEDPEFDKSERLLIMAFEPIKLQLKRDLKKYEKTKSEKSANGAIGNLKRWHVDLYNLYQKKEISLEEAVKVASNRIKSGSDNNDGRISQNIANIAVTVNDTVDVDDTVTVTDTVTDIDKGLYVADAPRNQYEEDFPIESDQDRKEKSSAKKESEKFGKPEFRQTLLDIGADPQHVEDWIKVRTAKRAGFTATSLQLVFDECTKHNLPVAEAIKICAGRSWQGFKYEWYLKEINNGKQTPVTGNQSRQQRVDEVAEFRRDNQQAIIERLHKYTTGDTR